MNVRRDEPPSPGLVLVAFVVAAALVAYLAGVAAVVGGADRAAVVAVAAVVLAAVGAGLAGQQLLTWLPPAAPWPRRPGAPAELHAPAGVERIERAAGFSGRAVDYDALLRPVLRDIAAHRLRLRGIDLDDEPRAEAALGPGVLPWLRTPPASVSGGLGDAGVPLHTLVSVVDALERL